MQRALGEFQIAGRGVKTTIPFHQRVLADPRFRSGDVSTDFVEQFMAEREPAGRGRRARERARTSRQSETGARDRRAAAPARGRGGALNRLIEITALLNSTLNSTSCSD